MQLSRSQKHDRDLVFCVCVQERKGEGEWVTREGCDKKAAVTGALLAEMKERRI